MCCCLLQIDWGGIDDNIEEIDFNITVEDVGAMDTIDVNTEVRCEPRVQSFMLS